MGMSRVDECRKRVIVAAFAYGFELEAAIAGGDGVTPQLESSVRAYKAATSDFRAALREERHAG